MNMKRGLVAFIAGFVFLFTNPSNAADPLTKEKLEQLISGNTAEGQNVEWEKGVTWYFQALGQIRGIDEHGNRGKGRWAINEEGELCVQFKRGGERCRRVVPRTGGGYDIYGTEYPEEDDLKWRFSRILPGNPHDL
jgi:hypothetical protein